MDFTKTADCVKFSYPGPHTQRPLPLPDLTDEDIDEALLCMLEMGATEKEIPDSQFGRRKAVEGYLRYEKIKPVKEDLRPWEPKHPAQPR